MSGDVQPRKRKDKKRKKDELGVEEPRGTAAALGEGDVFMHSQHDHGTGGHWCAKIIFFSLLAVLVTLIGLIILENRGVSELEANSVETRYSGVLEGWLEDAPDDDHHDEHTLELLKQHADDNEPNYDNDESDEEKDDDEGNTAEDEDDNFQNDQYKDRSVEDDGENSRENDDEEDEEHEEEEADSGIEVEKLEKEMSDDDIRSEEHSIPEAENDDNSQEVPSELSLEDDGAANDEDDAEDEEFLDDDIDESLPVVERIVAPKGKPFIEVEDEPTTFKPADTLADEEEYEKQQEELRRDEAQASHVWLKLAVGGALLVATHAVVSRAFGPRDNTPASEDHDTREDTPSISDRRMTLILEEADTTASPTEVVEEVVAPIVEKPKLYGSKPISKEESEEEEEVIIDTKDASKPTLAEDLEAEDKELYSDEEDADKVDEEDEDLEQEKIVLKQLPVSGKESDVDEDVPDDVEIIDDERLEEELEEEEEDDISDVDDAELLTRLEAKYGRLPEPERGYNKPKDGGNSVEDEWPGEPSDKYWRQQLDEAEQELRQGAWSAALARASAMELRSSARARWLVARALDAQAEARRDNRVLSRAIAAYLDLLKLNERLSDARLREIATQTLDRIRFRGNYLSAEPIYRLLIRRFPDVVDYRNNLTVSYLMANRADLAEEVIKETLGKWPEDRFALAHLGFILKTQHNRLEEAVEVLQKALEGDVGAATEPRFYYHLGDSLLLLNRFTEAHEVHKRGAKLGHFLSPNQRSLYNVNRLKSRPWWNIEQTPYLKLAKNLEKSWKDILKEAQAAHALYEKEKEGLKERGEWSQLDIFVRGQEVPGRCKEAPVTCRIVRAEQAAAGCRRGQVKFSAMEAGTHVRPHVGPTNCRLRMHLGLSNTKDTYIRVDQETRQWQVGQVFMFDDSFEHEVWHNGTGTRLVLIVDVWHPALTAEERRQLPAI